ncbi:MAG: DegT/DnrJ/EryC1/StrS family aminotransferase [Flavobacteriales bacterium]
MRTIPFSPPRIDEVAIDAVTEVLKSGWITTGPKTRLLEEKIKIYTNSKAVICLNSWTNAAELALRWFGVGEGDEVIIPAYTYAATANIIKHVGATPILVDSNESDCLIDLDKIVSKITSKTKVIMPVDIAGMPVDYDRIIEIINQPEIKQLFNPSNEVQKQLGRILFLSDAAHSFGAMYKGSRVGNQADIAGFSFHAVKNLTTAEGGALTFNLPEPFDNSAIRASFNVSALHGQTKDAFSKTQAGQWRYDIVEAGFKCNMTDIHAAIGIVEFDRYEETLNRRKEICDLYSSLLGKNPRAILPEFSSSSAQSCYHLYMLRIEGYTEQDRDLLIQKLAEKGISTNVHFQPLPMLSFYKNLGYQISEYPNAFKAYANEISLPVYFNLSNDDIQFICDEILSAI